MPNRNVRSILAVPVLILLVAGCTRDPSSTTGLIPPDPETPGTPPSEPAPARSVVSFTGTAETGLSAITLPTGALDAIGRGINNSGQVVGSYMDANQIHHAFVWSKAEGFRDVFPDADPLAGANTTASAINDLGQVTGTFTRTDRRGSYVRGAGSQTVTIPSHGSVVVARAINNEGSVAGESVFSVPNPAGCQECDPNSSEGYITVSEAFVWNAADGLRTLPRSSGAAQAYATSINNSGGIAGVEGNVSEGSDFAARPLVWGATNSSPVSIDIQSVDSIRCEPVWVQSCEAKTVSINSSGEIAGTVSRRAFRLKAGGEIELITLQNVTFSVATGINNRGDVVGFAGTATSSTPFIWYADGTVRWMGTLSGRKWLIATGINDTGQIVGYAR